jgi:sugar/nucleoside kinase (ribokinase family)
MNEENKKFDMIAIGDTTQDIFLEVSDASVQCDLDGENCRISFDYADKIAVDKKTDVPAVGNAANHAIGAARLGLKTALYTVVGDDVQGRLAGDVLKENNVDPSYLAFDKKNGTNFSAVINFKGERTILVYHEPREYKLPEFAETEWVYLTSASGDGVESLHKQVEEYLEKNPSVKLSFNPGTHQMHLGREALEPLLAKTDVLFLNIQEAAEVLGVKTKDVKELAVGYHGIGVKNIVLTDGPDGAYVSDGSTIWYLGIFKGPVVERTGCGDSFGSGFMGAVIQGKPFSEAMLWGNSNSTSVVQFIGAREGLLSPDAITKMIDENPEVRPQEFAKI